MKRIFRLLPALVFAALFAPSLASAQNSGVIAPDILPDGIRSPVSPEHPQWVQDLRRGEIVAFGSFPFTMFFSTITMDSIRFFKHDMNRAYLPWPLKGPGAIEMSREEKKQTIMIAAAVSVTIAIVDFAIVKIKRRQEERRERMRDRGEIRVNRSPSGPGTAADSEESAPGDP
ncbi:MAG: hypothetical protein LBO76_00295 [Treponema sp.]|jgi:hypothetical protein|nr:hypothetical protein [Treponema sp.]